MPRLLSIPGIFRVETRYEAEYLHHYFSAAMFEVGHTYDFANYHYTETEFFRWRSRQTREGTYIVLPGYPTDSVMQRQLGMRTPPPLKASPKRDIHRAHVIPLSLP